jgi:8-oxo-dGTP diphosphatase/(d)CTP diphosphatase
MEQDSRSTNKPGAPVVGVLGIIRRGDRLLLIRRAKTVKAPLAWCFPGGHVEEGETQPEALVREMREELNLSVRPGEYLMTQTKHDGRLILHCWSATIPEGEPVANPSEVADLAWLTPVEIRAKDGVLLGTTAILDAIGL